MKNLIRRILKETEDKVKVIKHVEEKSALEKEFGINLNNNRFIKDDEVFYDIYENDEKVGYMVISTEKYEEYNFQEILNGRIIFLNFIRLRKQGLLRESIEKLKQQLNGKYDYLILEVAGDDYNKFQELKSKYSSIGFKGIIPDNIGEYDLGLSPEIDPYEEDVFMYTEIK